MSGELQTIPARHGVATFVPRGRTIKIINTYGTQVVSTWAFSLAAPPEKGDDDLGSDEEIESQIQDLDETNGQAKGADIDTGVNKKDKKLTEDPKDVATDTVGTAEKLTENADDPPEEAPGSPEDKKLEKRTWASYIPSIPYRSKAPAPKTDTKQDPKAENAQNEAASKKWSSYLPTGKGFSSYVPNLQVPDTKDVVSAFQASHYRDPNKSYAEQLYDFSKTPVGAGTIAAASGSGTASSIYAAYSAYTKIGASSRSQPPMEYLSLPHTRASTHRLVPEVHDTLLTNLRSPIMTLVEDTTPGAHDTLTAACDAALYKHLGVDKPEEHGSCAVNLVLALKELNETAGLRGTKAIGADITVNIAPTPLHLFMNAPIEVGTSSQSEGSGARGANITIDEPKGKKRSYVRFRAERDIVIVLSACPMDVGNQNGGRCMAANFMVEEADEANLAASTSSLKKKGTPRKLGPSRKSSMVTESEKNEKDNTEQKKKERPETGTEAFAPTPMPRPRGGPGKIAAVLKSAGRQPGDISDPAESGIPDTPPPEMKEGVQTPGSGTPKTKKKPKKLERRTPARE